MTVPAPRIARAPAGGCMAFGSFYEGGEFLPAAPTEPGTPSARQIEADTKRQERAAVDAERSRHVGVVGNRLDVAVTVGAVLTFHGQYGATFITITRDTDGNVFVSRGARWASPGEALRIVASVKAHEVRDGVRQTILQRVRAKP